MTAMWYTESLTPSSMCQFGRTSSSIISITKTNKQSGSGGSSSSSSSSDVNVDNLRTANGTASQYLSGYGYHHKVTLNNLPPGTRITYRCGCGMTQTWSEYYQFTSAQSSTSPTYPFGIALYGDMGYLGQKERPFVLPFSGLPHNWTAVPTRNRLEALKATYDTVWHLGDIGYADDAFVHTPGKFAYESVYNGFVNWMQNLSATRPYMVSVGNRTSNIF